MLKKSMYLCLTVSLPAVAADDTAQRLWQTTRQAVQIQERKSVEDNTLNTGMESPQARRQDTAQEDNGEALFMAVNRSDWPQVRRLLNQYRQQAHYDQDIALFAEAALNKSDGRMKEARQKYEQLLQRQPDFTRGRLDLARLLFDDHLNRESAAEFAKAKQEPLPEPVLNNIQAFQTAIDRRRSWQGSVNVGGIWNSNVNQGSNGIHCTHEFEDKCIGNYWTADKPETAAGLKYETAVSRHWQVKGHHGVNVRALAYGRVYRNHQKHNEHTANLSAGYQFTNARRTVTAAPLWEWSAEGKHASHRAYGLRTEWDENLGNWSWNTEAEWKKLKYFDEESAHNNGTSLAVYNTVSYSPRADWAVFGGLDWLQRKTSDGQGDYRQPSLRLGIGKQFEQGFDASAHAVFQQRTYKSEDRILEKRRRDHEQTYILNIGAERWRFAGMKPTLTFKHRRVNSNIQWLYQYRQNEVGVSLMKVF